MITGISFETCKDSQVAEYKVFDTDFTEIHEVDLIKMSNHPYACECVKVIIHVYENKKLNVAANIAVWLMGVYLGNPKPSLEECKKYVPEYSKYADDVEKYLMLA